MPLCAHDDATVAHVDEAHADGCVIAEFPVTLEAARASRGYGMMICMGGPNFVRGSSHSGNLSARACAEEDMLDKAWGLEPNSRLSCQAIIADEDLVVEIPKYTINHAAENH